MNIPDDSKIVYVTPIYMKGKRNDCSNYRGTSEKRAFSRIYGRIINGILEEEFKAVLREA